MPQRIKQHQLEDLSRLKFGLELPKIWVFRDKDKDYGIDGEVEVFDKDGKASGDVFWVQLKATSSRKASAIKSIDFSIERLRYYKRLDISVLIARYSEFQDKFYVKWSNEIDLYNAKENAKTIRIMFTDEDILNEHKVRSIEQHLQSLKVINSGRLNAPFGINFNFLCKNPLGFIPQVLSSKLRIKVAEHEDLLYIDNENNIKFDVSIDDKKLKISILDIYGCTFHNIDKNEDSNKIEFIFKNIILGVSATLFMIGYRDLSARIIFEQKLEGYLKKNHQILSFLLPSLLNTNYFKNTLELVSDASMDCDNNLLETITSGCLLYLKTSNSSEKSNAVIEFLNRISDKYINTDPEMYGISQYNLGNFLRSKNRLKEAIRSYLKARRYQPKYYHQEYFYRELAGILFDYGKYRYSASFYKKALEFSDCNECRPQYADALMFAGYYQESFSVFDTYLKETKDNTAEWLLKSMCLESLIEKYHINAQLRNKQIAIDCSDPRDIEETKLEESLKIALKHDLLCGLAWYNLGHLYQTKNKFEDASFCFTLAALIQRGDVESWIKATMLSFNEDIPIEIFVLLIRAAYSCNGERFISELYQVVAENIGDEFLSHIAPLVEKIISEEKEKKPSPILRIMNNEEKFKDIHTHQEA